MRIAITGGMGFIGSEVAAIFESTGDEVIIVDYWQHLLRRYESERFPILDRTYGNLSRAADVMEPGEFIDRIHAVDIIIHLGAVVDTMDLGSDNMMEQNVRYVRQLIDAASNGRLSNYIPGIIFASSAATYGSDFTKPNNPYGLTKVLGERIISSTRGQFACLRFFNVFGTMEHHKGTMASVPFKIAQAYRSGDRFDLHSPDSSRDFISVSSVAKSIERLTRTMFDASDLGDDPTFRCLYDVGTGKSTSFADVDNFIMQATGNSRSIVRDVQIPQTLIGRYQYHTCAGIGPHPIPVLNDGRNTQQGIEEQYGSR